MKIDNRKLREMIESYAVPLWDNSNNKDKEWVLRKGGGETYVQEKVLKKAGPYITEENLRKNAKEAVINALKSHQNSATSSKLSGDCQPNLKKYLKRGT